MNKEDFFIHSLSSSGTVKNRFIGDDGVLVEGMVYSKDAFFENVHFKRAWFTLFEIAQKAMLVNISDAIAMNARPKYALLSVAIPSYYTRQEIRELAEGFLACAKAYGIEIIGGDTISNTKLDISVTLVSVPGKKTVLRSGIKKGDLIAHTGLLGGSLASLKQLMRYGKTDASSRFKYPLLREDFFYQIAPSIHAAIDISDGLFFELERLSKTNMIGFDLFENIPKRVGCSGEEYEILFAFSPQGLKRIRSIAAKTRTPLNIIGEAVRGKFRCHCHVHHF